MSNALADPEGRRRCAPPQQDQFLLFSHIFSPKSVHIGDWHPSEWVGTPPMGNPGSATVMHQKLCPEVTFNKYMICTRCIAAIQ